MSKFLRRNPVEAFEYTGNNLPSPLFREPGEDKEAYLYEPDGTRRYVFAGEWVVTDERRHSYSYSPDIFAERFAPVNT